MNYYIVIHKDKNSFGVTIPDLSGCFTAGSNIEDAIKNAKEAAECHIEGLLLDGEKIPIKKGIEEHQKNLDFKDGIWAIIDINLNKISQKTKRINITIPEPALKTIDNYVKKHKKSRSNFLTNVAMEHIFSNS